MEAGLERPGGLGDWEPGHWRDWGSSRGLGDLGGLGDWGGLEVPPESA